MMFHQLLRYICSLTKPFVFVSLQCGQRSTIHLPAGRWPGDQRMGPRTGWHVRRREETTDHPTRIGIRRPWGWKRYSRRYACSDTLTYSLPRVEIAAGQVLWTITGLRLFECLWFQLTGPCIRHVYSTGHNFSRFNEWIYLLHAGRDEREYFWIMSVRWEFSSDESPPVQRIRRNQGR